MINKVMLMGRITRDPELKTTPSGISVCRFSVAVDRYAKQGEEKQCDFLDITAWRQTADFVCKYFSKGRMIFVEGRLQNDNYTDQNGNKIYRNTIIAEKVDFCGDKSSGSASQAQPQTYAAAAAPQAQSQAKSQASVQQQKPVELGDFQEILSDNEPPF